MGQWWYGIYYYTAFIHVFPHPGLSRASVLRQVESSLASLQRSSVDILYLHAPDHSTDVEETLEACQQLYKGIYLADCAFVNVIIRLPFCFACVMQRASSRSWVCPTLLLGKWYAVYRPFLIQYWSITSIPPYRPSRLVWVLGVYYV